VTNFIAYEVLVSPRVICRSNLSFLFFCSRTDGQTCNSRKK